MGVRTTRIRGCKDNYLRESTSAVRRQWYCLPLRNARGYINNIALHAYTISWLLHHKLNRTSDSRAKVKGKSPRSPSPTQRTTGGQGTLRGDKQSSMTNPEWSALKACIQLILHRLSRSYFRIYVYTLVCMYQPLTEKEVLNSKESKQEYIEGFEGRKRKGERMQPQSQK